MQTNHANALRGLSIAVVIIAGLTILACIIGAVFLGVGGSYLANMTPDMWEYYLYDGDYYGYGYDYDYYGFDGADMAAIMALLVGIGGIALFMAILFTVPALIAGILGLRNYNVPAKLNLAFGWSLAGAITGFLTGNIPTMVLLIIMCVFSHKDKQLGAVQPVMVGQPVAAVPVAAVPQPVQPVQPAQPAQPMAAEPVAAPAAAVVTDPTQPAPPVAPDVAQVSSDETVVAEEIATPVEVVEEVIATEETKSE